MLTRIGTMKIMVVINGVIQNLGTSSDTFIFLQMALNYVDWKWLCTRKYAGNVGASSVEFDIQS